MQKKIFWRQKQFLLLGPSIYLDGNMHIKKLVESPKWNTSNSTLESVKKAHSDRFYTLIKTQKIWFTLAEQKKFVPLFVVKSQKNVRAILFFSTWVTFRYIWRKTFYLIIHRRCASKTSFLMVISFIICTLIRLHLQNTNKEKEKEH